MSKSKKIRKQVYNKFNGRCGYCGWGMPIEEMQIDHIIPKANFIEVIKYKHIELKPNQWKIPESLNHLRFEDCNHIDNLMPTCGTCNNFKSSKSLEEFRNEIKMQVERARRNSSQFRRAERYGLIVEIKKPIQFYFEKIGKVK